MTHDLVIRDGLVIDGTGAPGRIADLAVDGGLITAVGPKAGAARRVIKADGRLVLPGWVDIHTHYDGQAMWDPWLAPSSYHGVTTAVFGNCGVGFAPVKPGTEPYLINLMEGVEDIPGTVLSEGLDFRWESFPEFMAALDETRRVMDIGCLVPHAALRFYCMGEAGADHAAVPSAAEIARMGRLLEEALAAGALGFSTSRTTKHKAADGRLTPSLSAREPELFGIALAMKRQGKGVLEVNSDFGPGEFEVLSAAAAHGGRPLTVLLLQTDNEPDLWRQTLDQIQAANRAGRPTTGQVGSRPIGILMGLETSVHPFLTNPAWTDLSALTPRQRYRRLREDAALRRRLVANPPDDGHTRWMRSVLERTFRLEMPLDYEPEPARSVARTADRDGVSPWAKALEWMMADDGKAVLLHPFENYYHGNLDVVSTMIEAEHTIFGLADGGAHVGLICDASAPTSMISHWTRDRSRGPKLPIEFLVRKQTHDTAHTFGLTDRGALRPGLIADINVVDHDEISLLPPRVVYDLPTGGKRLMQKATGYAHTFKSGTEIMCAGEPTGARPGVLLRG